jgi:hypothetical protein
MDNPKKRLLSQATADSSATADNADQAAATSITTASSTTTTTTIGRINNATAMATDDNNATEDGNAVENHDAVISASLPAAKRAHVELNSRTAAKAEAVGALRADEFFFFFFFFFF